jgi:hypothetical protein
VTTDDAIAGSVSTEDELTDIATTVQSSAVAQVSQSLSGSVSQETNFI